MIKLLNSAMMPVEGVYKLQRISPEDFSSILRSEEYQSYIGYPDTARMIEEIAKVSVPLSREQTTVQDGDILLICRLKYRLQDPAAKGKFTPSVNDFEFFRCEYSSENQKEAVSAG